MLQELESYGLLAGAFRPADEIVILRGYMRQRQMLVKTAAIHIQHMQKALQQMNLRLDNVVADITGQTGMRKIKALLAGERNVNKLADLCDPNCKATHEVIAKSLIGNYRQEHLFSLKQAVELFEIYQLKIRECEQEIEAYAATAFRQAAISTQASDSDLGAYYRRMKARLGGPKAVTATAHKLARLYYRLLKHGEEYVEAGARVYEEKHRERVIRSLQKRARGLGFELVATAPM